MKSLLNREGNWVGREKCLSSKNYVLGLIPWGIFLLWKNPFLIAYNGAAFSFIEQNEFFEYRNETYYRFLSFCIINYWNTMSLLDVPAVSEVHSPVLWIVLSCVNLIISFWMFINFLASQNLLDTDCNELQPEKSCLLQNFVMQKFSNL